MKKLQHNFKTIIAGMVLVVSTFSATLVAQQPQKDDLWPGPDTAQNPHDLKDEMYKKYGIDLNWVVDRRTGLDGWSVFSYSSDPAHSDLRVTVTLTAYDQNGGHLYWYPLGDVNDAGFIPDRIGRRLREMAVSFPMYVFPDRNSFPTYEITGMRQSALIDNSWQQRSFADKNPNPLGVRRVIMVNYTEAALSPDADRFMKELAEKNGLATDKTPIIKTIKEIKTLLTLGYVRFDDGTRRFDQDIYRIGPVIEDPTKFTIARDAFLLMPLADRRPLEAEEEFVKDFLCLQNTGEWCE